MKSMNRPLHLINCACHEHKSHKLRGECRSLNWQKWNRKKQKSPTKLTIAHQFSNFFSILCDSWIVVVAHSQVASSIFALISRTYFIWFSCVLLVLWMSAYCCYCVTWFAAWLAVHLCMRRQAKFFARQPCRSIRYALNTSHLHNFRFDYMRDPLVAEMYCWFCFDYGDKLRLYSSPRLSIHFVRMRPRNRHTSIHSYTKDGIIKYRPA